MNFFKIDDELVDIIQTVLNPLSPPQDFSICIGKWCAIDELFSMYIQGCATLLVQAIKQERESELFLKLKEITEAIIEDD